MDNIKVGLIGSGFIAEPHLYSLKLLPNVDIAGISSRNEITAKRLIKKFNLDKSIFMSYEELLKLDIDAVSVCLPNYLHKDVTVDLLRSGKHVFIEKPLARNISESKEMLDIERVSNRKIFYCENNMYAPSFTRAKKIIEEGGIGDIYLAHGKEQHSGPHSEWFYKKDMGGGGSLIDLGIHDIACLVWYLGCDVTEVFCQIRTLVPFRETFGDCEVEDNAVGILYFENGAQVVIEESWTAPGGYDIKYEVFGTEGQIKVSPTFSDLVRVYSEKGYGYAVEKAGTTKGWTYPVPEEAWTFGYPQEMSHFVDCIINKKRPLTDGAFGHKILVIVETMYKSAKSKKVEEVLY